LVISQLPHEIERIVEVGGPKRVAKCLHVNTDVGLPEDPTKQEAYVTAFGRNVIKEQPAKPFWVRMRECSLNVP
jgi:hypothetical protein